MITYLLTIFSKNIAYIPHIAYIPPPPPCFTKPLDGHYRILIKSTRLYATDVRQRSDVKQLDVRQTDVRQHHRLMPLGGGVIINCTDTSYNTDAIV